MRKIRPLITLAVLASFTIACSDQDKVPEQALSLDEFAVALRGYHFPQGVVAMPEYGIAWVQKVTAGYSPKASTWFPGKVQKIKNNDYCGFTTPAENELVQHAFISTSTQQSSVFIDPASALQQSISDYMANISDNGIKDARLNITRPYAMKVIDVFVTEASQPVYLILTTHSRVIWNIHKASSAKIARIILIGSRDTGIVNIDKSTPVEVLSGETLANCHVKPLRYPADHWRFVQNINFAYGSDVFKKNKRYYRRFAKWLRKKISAGAADNMFDVYEAEHVLIGPVPPTLQERIAYKSIEDKTVYIATEKPVTIVKYKNLISQHRKAVKEYVHDNVTGNPKVFN